MSTQVTAQSQFRSQLVGMSSQFANALPSHIKPERFQRVVMTVVTSNPDLLNADRQSLFDSCIKCAADGLIPDGREAALTVFNTKIKVDGRDQWIKKVQYLPMLAGILKRVRNSGVIRKIGAHVVYENDHFLWRQGCDETIEHTPLFPGDRGKPIGAYALAVFNDGSEQFEVMDLASIERIRKSSKSGEYGPWKDWWDEMARKSVFKRLAKWLPLDADVDALIEHDNEIERIDPVNVTPDNKALPPSGASSKLDALDPPKPSDVVEQVEEVVEAAIVKEDDF